MKPVKGHESLFRDSNNAIINSGSVEYELRLKQKAGAESRNDRLMMLESDVSEIKNMLTEFKSLLAAALKGNSNGSN